MFTLASEEKSKVEKRSSQFYKVMKNALKVKDEPILIISDHGNGKNNLSAMLGYGYHHLAQSKGLNTSILFQEVKKGFMHADGHVTAALQQLPQNSIIIVAVSNKIGRLGEDKSFRTFCKEKGHRFLSATGLGDVQNIHFDLFLEAMSVNYKRMKKKGLAIKKEWDKAAKIRVRTDAGTDVIFDVTNMQAIANIGEYHQPGEGGNMPAGEVYIPPRGQEGVHGKIVIDGSIKTEKGALLMQEPITMIIEKGKVVSMDGPQAALLENTFRIFEDRAKYPERVRLVCELGIGINPGAVLIGSTIIDEKAQGTGHIALGSNYWFGGEIKTIFHGDMVFKNPVFYVDGKKMEF